jgi:hypothetical protein
MVPSWSKGGIRHAIITGRLWRRSPSRSSCRDAVCRQGTGQCVRQGRRRGDDGFHVRFISGRTACRVCCRRGVGCNWNAHEARQQGWSRLASSAIVMIHNPPSDRDTMRAQKRGLVDVYTAGSYTSLQTSCMEDIRELYETRLPRRPSICRSMPSVTAIESSTAPSFFRTTLRARA